VKAHLLVKSTPLSVLITRRKLLSHTLSSSCYLLTYCSSCLRYVVHVTVSVHVAVDRFGIRIHLTVIDDDQTC